MDSNDKRIRLILAGCFAVFAGYIALIFYTANLNLPEGTVYIIESAVYEILPFLAAVVAIIAWIRAERNHKRFMMYLAGATTLIFLTEMAWIIQSALLGGLEPPHLNISDVFSFSYYVFFALAVLSMAHLANMFRETRVRHFIDVVIFTLFAAIAIWYFDVRHVFLQPSSISAIDRLFMTIFPVLDLGLIFGVFFNIVGYKHGKWRIWEIFISLGIVFLAVADTAMAYLSADQAYLASNFSATLLDVGWLTAYFMFFLAALTYLLVKDKSYKVIDEVAEFRLNSQWRELLIYASILGTMTFFVLLAVANNAKAYDTWAITAFGSILVVLLSLRAIFYVAESNRLVSTSLTDPLTGVYNYRFFQTRFDEELERAKRYGESLSIAIIDIDNFGQVNKVLGHSIGDDILKAFASILHSYSRLPDSVCRVGGDEFAVILPQTQGVEALKVYIRVKQKLAEENQKQPDRPLPEFTCGISTYPRHGLDKEMLQKSADIALHWAKRHGKGQVLMFEPDYMDNLVSYDVLSEDEQLAYINTVQAIAASVDARHEYTRFHSKSVARLAVDLAIEAGYDQRRVQLIETAALLHDVGKIGISDKVLNKEGPLTADEVSQVEEHPLTSEKILTAAALQEILPWIIAHHERWDGQGYPNHLKGEAIPKEARILAICDAYDAMTSDRPYRDALTPEEAIKEIEACAGTQFEKSLAKIFVTMLSRNKSMPAGNQF